MVRFWEWFLASRFRSDVSRLRRGQVSAEMLILTAALVAVALLLVTQLQHTAETGKDVLSKQAAEAFKQIGKIN